MLPEVGKLYQIQQNNTAYPPGTLTTVVDTRHGESLSMGHWVTFLVGEKVVRDFFYNERGIRFIDKWVEVIDA